MSVLYVVLPIALSLAGLALLAFARSIRTGQYDDLDTPPIRAVHDED
jgi:cbb3-type cytochrome oxidase maturation protein